ncbi:hypothetical protein WA026_002435 [Henosepilachna vigintioctopunctata]|uniref:Uncharacterized protein n=1 Tax=Henosepilachna vigintioctopunctata TaxID=420089 RepID=A0AAW1U3W5_9CUCU
MQDLDNETEQRNHESIEEFTNELKANEENNDAQELPKLKDGHKQSTTLSNSFQDGASDINESRNSGDNSDKKSEKNGFSPAHTLAYTAKTIAACTSATHELNEVENLGNSLFEKKGDSISDSISSNKLVVTSNDTSNSTEDQEHSKTKENQYNQQHENNSLETTEQAPENERPPSDNSISRGKIIDSQNEVDNKSSNMGKEKHQTAENEMDSTEPKADITNDDIPKGIEDNELEEEPNVLLSQKDVQVDMKEDYAENLSELNVPLTSVDGEDDNEPKKENSNQAEESTIRSELDTNNTVNYNPMSQIISTRSKETRLPRPDKKISKETDDNFRSFENLLTSNDSPKIDKNETKNKFNKKRSYSHRPETEQQEKSRNNKTNIRRVKSQETTTFRNQNKARRNSVSPVKHLSQKVSKNSIIDTVSHEAVTEPLAIRKNIVPNQSIQDDMKSALDDVTSTTDERIESEITPTDFAGEKLETSNVQMETSDDIDQSEERNFITEDNRDSSEKILIIT